MTTRLAFNPFHVSCNFSSPLFFPFLPAVPFAFSSPRVCFFFLFEPVINKIDYFPFSAAFLPFSSIRLGKLSFVFCQCFFRFICSKYLCSRVYPKFQTLKFPRAVYIYKLPGRMFLPDIISKPLRHRRSCASCELFSNK